MGHDSAMLRANAPPKGKSVSARFEYRRMSGKQLADELAEIDLASHAFCRIFGVRPEVMGRWLKDDQEVPPWVFVALWLLRECPNGIAIARTAAANHILHDRKHPHRGEFPYLTIPDDEEDSP